MVPKGRFRRELDVNAAWAGLPGKAAKMTATSARVQQGRTAPTHSSQWASERGRGLRVSQ